MGGPALFRLQDELHRVGCQRLADPVCLMADHDQRPLHAQATTQLQHVTHHGQAAQRMEHLGEIRPHSGPLPGRHHDGAHFVGGRRGNSLGRGHERPPSPQVRTTHDENPIQGERC